MSVYCNNILQRKLSHTFLTVHHPSCWFRRQEHLSLSPSSSRPSRLPFLPSPVLPPLVSIPSSPQARHLVLTPLPSSLSPSPSSRTPSTHPHPPIPLSRCPSPHSSVLHCLFSWAMVDHDFMFVIHPSGRWFGRADYVHSLAVTCNVGYRPIWSLLIRSTTPNTSPAVPRLPGPYRPQPTSRGQVVPDVSIAR